MQLESKHLVSYLPYGLKVQVYQYIDTEPRFRTDDIEMLSDEVITFKGRFTPDWYFDYAENEIGIKPILRPLSDLTKEIEHNGKDVVPIIDLLKIKHPAPEDHKSKYGLIGIGFYGYPKAYYQFRANYEIMVNINDLDNTPYWIIKKLIEWKFDVFGLIDTGLAISLHDLPENPYK